MQRSTNTDQMNALVEAFAVIAKDLKQEEGQTLAASIPPKIQSATDTFQMSALTRAFTAILPQLKPKMHGHSLSQSSRRSRARAIPTNDTPWG